MTHGISTIDYPRFEHSPDTDPADQRLEGLTRACAEGIESAAADVSPEAMSTGPVLSGGTVSNIATQRF